MLETVVCGLANQDRFAGGMTRRSSRHRKGPSLRPGESRRFAGRMARRYVSVCWRPSFAAWRDHVASQGRTTPRSSRYVGGRRLRPGESRRFAGEMARRSSRYAGGCRLRLGESRPCRRAGRLADHLGMLEAVVWGLANHAVSQGRTTRRSSRYVGGRRLRPGEITPFRWPDDSQVISVCWRPSSAAWRNHAVSLGRTNSQVISIR